MNQSSERELLEAPQSISTKPPWSQFSIWETRQQRLGWVLHSYHLEAPHTRADQSLSNPTLTPELMAHLWYL